MNDMEPIRVLHVDDEPGFADMTASFLEREVERLAVDTATNVSEALDLLAEHQVDCVVSDYDMPTRNGIKFLETVREDHPDLPFILFTGKGSEDVASDAFRAGASDYLQKDTGTDHYEVLANRIRTLVAERRATSIAERQRHRQEQMLKTVPACIVRINPDGEFVFANDRAKEVLGLDPADVDDRTYNDPEWDITDLDGNPIPDEELPFRQVLDSGEPVQGRRHTIEWPDGTRKVLHVNGAPLFDDDGNIESTLFALTDITQEIHRQDELEQLKERYEAFVEHSEDILTVVNEGGIIEYQSPAIECVLGYTREELVGQLAFDYVHPDDRERVTRAFSEIVEAPDVAMERVVYRFRHADGSWRWLESVGSNRTDSALDGFVVNSRDITDRKEREQELEQAHELAEALSTTLPDYTFIYNESGEYLDVVTGWDGDPMSYIPEELIGENVENLLNAETADRILEAIRTTLDTGELQTIEYRIEAPRGTIWYEANLAPLSSGYGGERAVLLTARDITDRKEREAELGRERERLWAIFETVPFPTAHVRLVDGRNIVENVNPAFADVFGYDTEHLKGRCLNDVIVPDEHRDQAQRIDESIRDYGVIEQELTRETVEGRRDFLFRARQLDSEIDQPGREALGVYVDITERNERERKIQRQNERLEEFTRVVSHDLRNPLSVAKGNLDLAREDGHSEHLEAADNALDRMSDLIDDLLALAQTGETLGELDSVELGALAESSWQFVSTRQASVEIETDQVIQADESRLRQLFENLFRNAVEHGGGDVIITVGSVEDGFYVEDNGDGFDNPVLDEMKNSERITIADTGIGLTVVQDIADAHGWTVTINQDATGGARFDFTGVEMDEPQGPASSPKEQCSVD